MRQKGLGKGLFAINCAVFVLTLVAFVGDLGIATALALLGATSSLIESWRKLQRDEVSVRRILQTIATVSLVGVAVQVLQSSTVNVELGLKLLTATASFGGSFLASAEPITREMLLAAFDESRRRRSIMLDTVRRLWVTGALQGSVFDNRLVAVPLAYQPGTSAPNDAQTPLSADSKLTILKAFDDAEGRLLVLGEPGAGKSVQVYRLTEHLLKRAEGDEFLPIPIVYPLSSWARKRQPLEEWLIEEVPPLYTLPADLFTASLEADKFVLLLDGLDEVAEPYRDDCVEAINAFVQARPSARVVVSSRTRQYAETQKTLALNGTVRVRPLTPTLIASYLDGAGDELASVRRLLADDPSLWAFAASPLNLDLIARTFAGTSSAELPKFGDAEARREHLFEQHITRMFEQAAQRSEPAPHARMQTLHWLGWLAERLQADDETMLLVERMQPHWLEGQRERTLYRGLATALILAVGPVVGAVLSPLFFMSVFLGALLVGSMTHPVVETTVSGRLQAYGVDVVGVGPALLVVAGISLIIGVIGGGIASILGAALHARHRQIVPAEELHFNLRNAAIGAAKGAPAAALSAAGAWLAFSPMTFPWLTTRTPVEMILSFALALTLYTVIILIGGLPGTALSAFIFSRGRSERARAEAIRTGVVVGAAGALLSPLTTLTWLTATSALTSARPAVHWTNIAVGLAVGAVLGFVLNGYQTQLTTRSLSPNHGIRASLRNALLIGTVLVVTVGVLASLALSLGIIPFLLANRGQAGAVMATSALVLLAILLAPLFALFTAYLGALYYGGIAAIRHAALRVSLRLAAVLPLRLVTLLDYASDLVLLRRIGGAYEFYHPLLRDHIAAQYAGGAYAAAAAAPAGPPAMQTSTAPHGKMLRRRWLTLGLVLVPIVAAVGVLTAGLNGRAGKPLVPLNARVYLLWGQTYHDTLGMPGAALNAYDRAIQANPGYADAYVERGRALDALGEHEAAIAEYDEALRLGIEGWAVYNNRGVSHWQLNHIDEALEDYSRAINTDPNAVLPLVNRGQAYSALGSIDLALADFERAVALSPDDAVLYYYRGLLYQHQGAFADALRDAEELIERAPAAPEGYFLRGTVEFMMGAEIEDWAADLEHALSINPNLPDTLNALCWQYAVEGLPEQALPHCERAVELSNAAPAALDSRALAYALAGDAAAAIPDFEAYIALMEEQSMAPDQDPFILTRRAWVEALRAGENPFTPDVLESLRTEGVQTD